MTGLFIEAAGDKSTNRTYAQILELMDEKIYEFNIRGCFIRAQLRRLLKNDLRQVVSSFIFTGSIKYFNYISTYHIMILVCILEY